MIIFLSNNESEQTELSLWLTTVCECVFVCGRVCVVLCRLMLLLPPSVPSLILLPSCMMTCPDEQGKKGEGRKEGGKMNEGK